MTSEVVVRKLIDQIQVILDGRSEEEASGIARSFVDLTHEISDRLDRCCALARSGHRREAIELAEAEPPLLSLIALTGFAQLSAWEAFCRRSQLPIGVLPDARKVAIVNDLYASAQFLSVESLWKKYRDAISRREDAEGLKHLQDIVAQVPNDPAARAEIERLHVKVLRKKLDELRGAVTEGNPVAAEKLVGDLEAMDSAAFQEADIRPAALALLSAHQAKLRSAECQSLTASLPEWVAAGDYDQVCLALEKIRENAGLSDPGLDPPAQEHLEQARKWSAGEAEKRKEAAAFEDLIRQVRSGVAQLEPHGASMHRLPTAELEAVYQRLSLDWQKVLRCNREVPEALQVDVRKNIRLATEELERRRSAKRMQRITIGAFVLMIVGATAFLSFLWWRSEGVCRELERLMAAKSLQALVSLVAEARSNRGMELAISPHLRSTLHTADGWIVQQQEALARMKGNLPSIKAWAEDRFPNGTPEETYKRIRKLQDDLAALPIDEQMPLKEELAPVFELWALRETELAREMVARRKSLLAEVSKWLEGGEGLKDLGRLATTAEGLRSLKTELDASLNPAIPALVPETHEKLAAQKVTGEMDRLLALDEAARAVDRACRESKTLKAYQEALNGYREERFEVFPVLKGARKVATLVLDVQALRGRILMPKSPEGWAHLFSSLERKEMYPEDVGSEDFAILDDLLTGQANFSDLHRCVFVDSANQKATGYTVGVPGTYENSGETYVRKYTYFDPATGKIIDKEMVGRDLLKYRISQPPVIFPEAAVWKAVGIEKVLTTSQRFYVASLVEVIDRVLAAPGDCTVAKAFLCHQIGRILLAKPLEWRLYLCPRLERDLQALKEADAGSLTKTSWLLGDVPEASQVKYRSVLKPLKGTTYWREALMNRELVAKAGDFAFAGFVAPDGSMALRPEAAGTLSLVAVTPDSREFTLTRSKRDDAAGTPQGMFGEWKGAENLPPFSCLFHSSVNVAAVVNALPHVREIDKASWGSIVISPFFPPPGS